MPEAGQDAPTPWAWLVALTLLAAALRAIALNQQLWFDEIATLVNSVRRPLATILTTYTTQNQHTLYSVLAWGSIKFLGEQPWTLRLPAVVFGVASVPALYFFARQVTTRTEAFLASTLLVVSYHHVWFSQNARGYTGMLFFTLLATYFFIQGLREGGWQPWVGYSIAMGIGLYTHLTMGFVAGGHGVVYAWLLAARARGPGRSPRSARSPIAGFLLAGLLALALYAPLLPQLFSRTVGHSGSSIPWEWSNPLWMVLEALRGLSAGAGGGLAAVAAGGLVALGGLGSYWRRNPYVVGLMLLPGVLTAATLLALGHNLWPRFFFFAIGFAFLLLVRGAMVWGEFGARLLVGDARLGSRWGTVLVMCMLAGSAWSLRSAYVYPKQDFIGAMRLVDTERQPGEPVVTVGLITFPYQRYYGRDWRAVSTSAELESVRSRSHRIWLLYTLPIDLKARYPEIWKTIQTEFSTVGVFRGTLVDGEIYVCQAVADEARQLRPGQEP